MGDKPASAIWFADEPISPALSIYSTAAALSAGATLSPQHSEKDCGKAADKVRVAKVGAERFAPIGFTPVSWAAGYTINVDILDFLGGLAVVALFGHERPQGSKFQSCRCTLTASNVSRSHSKRLC